MPCGGGHRPSTTPYVMLGACTCRDQAVSSGVLSMPVPVLRVSHIPTRFASGSGGWVTLPRVADQPVTAPEAPMISTISPAVRPLSLALTSVERAARSDLRDRARFCHKQAATERRGPVLPVPSGRGLLAGVSIPVRSPPYIHAHVNLAAVTPSPCPPSASLLLSPALPSRALCPAALLSALTASRRAVVEQGACMPRRRMPSDRLQHSMASCQHWSKLATARCLKSLVCCMSAHICVPPSMTSVPPPHG
jgi:hypothetical protein